MALLDSKSRRLTRSPFHDGLAVAIVAATTVIILCLRFLVFQPFNIPSSSMAPTLLVGDYLFASKASYGYSHYSLPFSMNLFSGRIPAGWLPQRGDVVVFRVPGNVAIDYIKRIVGLPGERIQLIDGVVSINGVRVQRERIDDDATGDNGVARNAKRYRETLPNGVSYATLALAGGGFYETTQVYTVPPDRYFVLGDNRDNSVDSRFLRQVGYVPSENIIGRAAIIYFSIGDRGRLRWDRLFLPVR
jgi:signal peptidase I